MINKVRSFNLMILVVIGGFAALNTAVSQAKSGDAQDQIILLNDSAAALEDSDPWLSKNLTKFADEKELEYKNFNKGVSPTPITDPNMSQLQFRIRLLKAAALAIKPTYPLIAQGLDKMAKEFNRTIEIEK